MRPRTSETAGSQPSQAQATPAHSNHHHSVTFAPPVDSPYDQDSHHQPARETSQHNYPQEPPTHSQHFAQASYAASTSHFVNHFPVAPSSLYDAANSFSYNQHPYDPEYIDYDDDEDDVDEEDDEDMDMSDSDGGAPLGHTSTIVPVTSTLSPVPGTGAMLNSEQYPGSPHAHNTIHGQLPAEPPSHMTSYWVHSGPVFDPSGPMHPTPLNTIPFHPMLSAGGMDEDDDDTWQSTYPAISGVSGALQQHVVTGVDEEEEAIWQEDGPPAASNANPSTLGPENLCLRDFLRDWAWRNRNGPRPSIRSISAQSAQKVARVRFSDLEGDRCDLQGIDWEDLGVLRSEARVRRKLDYKNYTNRAGSDKVELDYPDRELYSTENFFRFRRMDVRQNVHLAHFQLRNILACAGRSRIYYPGQRAVHQLNPVTGQSEVAMDLSDLGNVQISTLDANCGVLIAGTFNGEYCMRNVHSQDKKYTEGQITNHISGITNHLQIHESRNSMPMAAFASNDQGFRVMDVATEKFVLETQYGCPINCSALSADRRLRVMVGDNYNVMIANADTGEILQELGGHRDFGFACDWSDNGYTVATGFQDMTVKIWDARKWTKPNGDGYPLETIRSEMAGVRSLRFSPTGSGPSVLVAAEEADWINVINAQTLKQKQSFDIFGEIGGVEFANDGQDLNVLCMDRTRGGLLQLERCDLGAWGGFESVDEQQEIDVRTPDLGVSYPERTYPPSYPAKAARKLSVFDDLEPF
ncbi:putative WD repeat-containing protein [Colletotrichum sp. SAR 10_70]|nr:putative WD repeat-containing protein [Colletotrichum sp. SAR 10_71]KAI8193783.1 putative WD repeat-containing protein [Colletotrichum sp. SAR 10_70]